jgi:dolichol-phosphate mannosyltransferase
VPGEPWLILPTYNEAENIGPFVRAVDAVLARAVPGGHRILVVDDNSPDGTGEIAVALADELEAVEVLRRPGKGGLGPAYLAGFAAALAGDAGFILEMDSDFSHDPEDLPRLLKAAEHADLVVGSRYVPGGGVIHWGLFRRAVSRVGCWYAQRVLGLGVRDLTGGFKCFRRAVLETIDLPSVRSTGYAFQVELTYRACEAGYRVAEVPIVFHERRAGHSKMSARIAIEAIWLVPDLRRRAAHALNPPGIRADA